MDYKNILKLVCANIFSGIFILDINGVVIFYNKSANDLAGISSAKSAVGKHILEVFPKLTEETSTLVRVLNTKESIVDYVQNYCNYQSKYVNILSNTLPLFENGELVGAVEIFTDVDYYKNIVKNKKNGNNNNNDYAMFETANYTLEDIKGKNSRIIEIKEKIIKIADSKSPVLVYGETGTGKELVVQSIHNESYRSNKPFIAQNCAAIPGTLLESILFGTALGSFTGAKDSKGLIEAADGGTLFLDEINSMDIVLQAKLLRVLQEGYIRRVGENKSIRVDVRIIAALNEDPNSAIEEGKIRKDLFYRLNVINFELPPLREVKDDLDELCRYFLEKFNRDLNKNVLGFSYEVKNMFNGYAWPGNIRELKHTIEHAINITEKDVISKRDLPVYFLDSKKSELVEDNKMINQMIDEPLTEIMNKFESKIIMKVLKQNDYNISQTSKKLNIPRQTLYYKMDKLGIRVNKNIKSNQ